MSHTRSSMKVALVTGCDSKEGIGQALCRELATRGLLVYATGLLMQNMATLREFAPHQIRTLVMDVTNQPQVQEVVNTVVAEVGTIDVLINNAGIAALAPAIEVDLALARRVHEVNFWGTWAVCKAAARHMVVSHQRCLYGGGVTESASSHSAVIVNIGSMASRGHPPFTAPYNTSKAAVESLSHTLRMELAPYGIAVVYVAPTWCRTSIIANAAVPTDAEWREGLYDAVRQQVLREARSAEDPNIAWPPSRLAKRIADAALRTHPPNTVYGGGQYRIFGLLAMMPHWLMDWVIMRKSGLTRLARLLARSAAGGDNGGGRVATTNRKGFTSKR